MRFSNSLFSLSWLSHAAAVLVAEGSPCGTLCGNVLDATTSADVVCHEGDYKSGAGIVYQQCLACEMGSDYTTSDNETDTEAALYNLRYAFSYCLFGVPDNDDVINTPCLTTTACGPFRDAVLHRNLSTDIGDYDYCDGWPVNDHKDFEGCKDCLRAGEQFYLANFFTVLHAGCKQQPEPGFTISIEGNVFSGDKVNITEPTPTATVNPDWFDQGPLTMEAKVGIAVGGIVLILSILGCCVIWRGKKRRRAFLGTLEMKQEHTQSPVSTHGQRHWPSPLVTRDMHETPLSQKPFRNWEDSPLSARSEKTYPRYFSPYSSQYNSPVSANEGQLAQWPVLSHETMHQYQPQSAEFAMMSSGETLSPERAYSKGKERDEMYEMHPVDGSQSSMGTHPGWETQRWPQQQEQQNLGYFVDRPNVTRYSPSPVEDERWKRAGL